MRTQTTLTPAQIKEALTVVREAASEYFWLIRNGRLDDAAGAKASVFALLGENMTDPAQTDLIWVGRPETSQKGNMVHVYGASFAPEY